MGKLTVKIIGCGDAFGSGGRAHTCFIVDDVHGRFAIDFGAGSLAALNARGVAADSIDAIFLSHFHGDHFGGLPQLLLSREFASDSDRPLTLVGPPGLKRRLVDLSESMFPRMWKDEWSFPLEFRDVSPGAPVDVLARRLQTFAVQHYAGAEASTAMRIATDGRILAFSGDTGWDEILVEVAKESDLFLCECYDRHKRSFFIGHLSYDELLENVDRLETRRLMITHLGPDMITASDADAFEQAADGMTIELAEVQASS